MVVPLAKSAVTGCYVLFIPSHLQPQLFYRPAATASAGFRAVQNHVVARKEAYYNRCGATITVEETGCRGAALVAPRDMAGLKMPRVTATYSVQARRRAVLALLPRSITPWRRVDASGIATRREAARAAAVHGSPQPRRLRLPKRSPTNAGNRLSFRMSLYELPAQV